MYNEGRYPYAGLGDIFGDINRIAGRVQEYSGQAQEVVGQAREVIGGRKKVALIPTTGSYGTIPVPGQPYGITFPLTPVLLGGAALVAALLLTRRR
jgi:hypothetical protein